MSTVPEELPKRWPPPDLKVGDPSGNERVVSEWLNASFRGLTDYAHTVAWTKSNAVRYVLNSAIEGKLDPSVAMRMTRRCIEETVAQYRAQKKYELEYPGKNPAPNVTPSMILGIDENQHVGDLSTPALLSRLLYAFPLPVPDSIMKAAGMKPRSVNEDRDSSLSVADHLTVAIPCIECGKSFEFSYEPSVTPFFEEPRGTGWPVSTCPGNHSFKYARRFAAESRAGLIAVFV
jgi:hypothetical protein